MAKYSCVYIFTKKGNLNDYLHTDKVGYLTYGFDIPERVKAYYAQEREIQLMLMFRYESNRCFCKIKCPVNPLPVRGEFEVPSVSVLVQFLKVNGWSYKQKFYPRMFE